jgi:hypothetical protein
MMLALLLIAVDPQTPARAASQPVGPPAHVADPRLGKGLSFYQLLAEMTDDLALDLSDVPMQDISPMALAAVHLSANLSPELEETLQTRTIARLQQINGLKQAYCSACFSSRSRTEGNDWIVSRGLVSLADMRAVAQELGVHTFLSIGLELIEEKDDDYLALNARIIRASDGTVVYARRILSDETRAALARDHRHAQTPEERRSELEAMLKNQPAYGHQAWIGYTFMPTKLGGSQGLALGYRLYERFGPNKSLLYGIQLQPFISIDGTNVFGGFATFVFAYTLSFDNAVIPRFRFGVDAGPVVTGTVNGNTVAFSALVEILFHAGFAVLLHAHAIPQTDNIGGIGITAAAGWTWE